MAFHDDSSSVPHEPAYALPWSADVRDFRHPRLALRGMEPVDFVTVFTRGDGRMDDAQLWGRVLPGEVLDLCLCAYTGDDVTVSITWFRERGGDEHIWSFTP
ncbi:hypothetical protein [Microbacterium sp. YY-01]|uniref:hypothetical protein n=1 Tax=Microbacterium sp. YY-01 TaxID=3421634 RepID=UPI003D177F73